MIKYRELWKARPDLKLVAPWSFWNCLAFALLDLGIGWMVINSPSQRLAIYQLIAQPIAGLFLFLMGGFMLIALLLNIWGLCRALLGIGLFLRALYAYSLVALGFQFGFRAVFGVTLIWFFIIWIQITSIIFFLPPKLTDRNTYVGHR